MQEVTTEMRGMGFNNMEWVHRGRQRSKIKLKTLGTERGENIKNLYITKTIIKIYKTIILPVVLYGCETWSLTLKDE